MADLILPDTAVAGELDHIPDHNKIVTAISTVNADLEAVETELGENPSGTYSTVAERLTSAYPASNNVLYTPIETPTFTDEFRTTSLDAAWVRVDAAGTEGRVTWAQGNDVLSVAHNASAVDGGNSHYLLRPCSPFEPGDAIVTAFDYAYAAYAPNNIFIQMSVSNGTTHGVSNAVGVQNYANSNNAALGILRVWSNPLMTTDGAQGGTQMTFSSTCHMRLVMIAANTWRADWSPNGVQWQTNATGGTLSYTLTPTHIGFGVNTWSTAYKFIASFHHIRRYSGVV